MAKEFSSVTLEIQLTLVILLLTANAASVEVLTIALYKVTRDGALIDWHFHEDRKELEHCEFVYGPVSDKEHQQISSELFLHRHTVDLSDLHFNVTYYFHMLCHDTQNNSYISNTINFTTGSERDDVVKHLVSSNYESIPVTYGETPYSVSLDADQMRSSNVILGAVCGIIGFLIINVTVVLAVRKYSHWQMRRRRIIELEDRDFDGFDYFIDEDDIDSVP